MFMKALITFLKKDNKGNRMYENGEPATDNLKIDFPLKFGHDPYGERILFGTGGINDCDIISIDVVTE